MGRYGMNGSRIAEGERERSKAMIELSHETIERILEKETAKKADLTTILRSIYTRYMRLYERYYADIDALTNETVDELRNYHEETRSLVKYYYMDIPLDICGKIEQFEEKYSDRLLGLEWHRNLFESYDEYAEKYENRDKSEQTLKVDFRKESLKEFYDAMGYIFREGFGTESQTAKNVLSGIGELIFGSDK